VTPASSVLDGASASWSDGTIGSSTEHHVGHHLIRLFQTVGAGGALALVTVSPVN
jgi:hypothetical protein